MNIVLIGPRGVGKSGVARALALLTKRPVLSTDLLLSYENDGLPIPQLLAWLRHDWLRFRELEYQVVAKCARMDDIIIDTGGGVVVDLDPDGNECLSQRKVSALRHNGLVVRLTGNLERLAQKNALDANRPALSATLSEETVMRRRDPFYQSAAHFTLATDGMKKTAIARAILDHPAMRESISSTNPARSPPSG
ncbi:MAG: shikimate kinase [Magnetococcales bacterium]|nr:shikimate kinase [Magnetococcales bacterium]